MSSTGREGSLEAPTRHPLDWQSDEFYAEEPLYEELERVFDICHGCRRCFNLCNAFPTLFDAVDESDTMEVDGVPRKVYWDVVDHCYLCDMCYMSKCPYVPPHEFAIDIPKLMLRHRAKNFKEGKVNFKEKQIAEIDRNGKLGQKSRPISNAIVSVKNKPTRYVMEKALNISREAKLPKFAKPFKEDFPINTI